MSVERDSTPFTAVFPLRVRTVASGGGYCIAEDLGAGTSQQWCVLGWELPSGTRTVLSDVFDAALITRVPDEQAARCCISVLILRDVRESSTVSR